MVSAFNRLALRALFCWLRIPRNCLSVGLDRWVDGGYLTLRRSAKRKTPHVLHVGGDGLQHYCPGAPLSHPIHALVGYDGVVWDRETADAAPMSLSGIVVGAWLLAFGATAWALHRAVFGFEDRNEKR